MSEITLAEFLSTASDIGVIGLLLMIIWGGAKAFWVWGWSHRESIADLREQLKEAKKERDEWKVIAISATDIGKRVVSVAEKSVQP